MKFQIEMTKKRTLFMMHSLKLSADYQLNDFFFDKQKSLIYHHIQEKYKESFVLIIIFSFFF